jgi:hypothetical protein
MSPLSSLANIYSSRAASVQTQIDAIQSQLSTGTKSLSTNEQSEVITLSDRSASYAAIDTSITQAKSVMGVAKTGLDSISGVLTQMQRLAEQANTPGMSNSDYMFFNIRYQKLLTQVGEIVTKANINGSNLLSGTAVLNVRTGIEINPKSNMVIQPINIMRMISAGVLGGSRIDDNQSAAQALDSIRAAINEVSNGQFQLNMSATKLDAISKSNTSNTTCNQSQLDSIQTLDTNALQAQLMLLQSEQKIDYQFMNQFNGSASSNLNIMT